jgi:hypothetical protein
MVSMTALKKMKDILMARETISDRRGKYGIV